MSAIFLFLFILNITSATQARHNKMEGNLTLEAYCNSVTKEFGLIDKRRKTQLNEIAQYIKDKLREKEPVKLTFICTHNSRRSQFGQAWAWAAAEYYGIKNVQTFSGGTEVTAANYRAMNALKRAGFLHVVTDNNDNPRNILKLNEKDEGKVFFSKKFNHSYNPSTGFAAIMVCSSADEACPVVMGAEKRFAIPYIDPKVSDNTPGETSTYDERCRQIAREMFYVFSKVK